MKTYGNGFVFMDGQLCSFEPMSYRLDFGLNESWCTAKISGKVTELNATNLVVYDSETSFKNSVASYGQTQSFADVFRNAYRFYPQKDDEGKFWAWAFRHGKAERINVSALAFEKDFGGVYWHPMNDEPLYENSFAVYMANDYVVDGVTKVSPKSRLALTESQREAVESFKAACAAMAKAGVSFHLDRSYDKMFFANGLAIEHVEYYDPNGDGLNIERIVESDRWPLGYCTFNSDNDESLSVVLN